MNPEDQEDLSSNMQNDLDIGDEFASELVPNAIC